MYRRPPLILPRRRPISFKTRKRLFVSFADEDGVETDAITYDFLSRSLGAAPTGAERRFMVVCVSAMRQNSGVSTSLSSGSVGGVAVSILDQAVASALGGRTMVAVAVAEVPTGTTGTVSLTFAHTLTLVGFGMYRVISGAGGITGLHDFAEDNGHPIQLSLDVPAGGAAFGVTMGTNSGAAAWTGLTEGSDRDLSTNEWASSAALAFVAAQTGLAVQMDSADETPDALVGLAVSIGPA